MDQWLGLRTFTAEGPGSIPGRGTKIPQATQCSQKKKKRKEEERSDQRLSSPLLPDPPMQEKCVRECDYNLGLK